MKTGRPKEPTEVTGQVIAMKIERKFTAAGKDAYAELDFTTTTSEIRNPDGTTVFKLEGMEVPRGWSQVAEPAYVRDRARVLGS